jgi:predicted acylesterase/phospholipase RssA
MQDPISAAAADTVRETAYRLAVGASKPIPVPDTPPARHCDVIMKGGITSGVVYPTAGVELAARYTLQSIGGTSAGAIAAGFFAAAERRRSVGGTAQGFEELRSYPARFGVKVDGVPFLQALFRPVPDARRLFALLTAFLEKNKLVKALKILGAVLTQYPLSLVGGAAGVLLVVLGRHVPNDALRIAAIVVGILAALIGFAVAAAALVAWDAITKLPKHKFGMCPGSGEPIFGYPPPLSDWIEQNLDAIAFGSDSSGPAAAGGLRPPGYAPDDPLTFGDLWGIGPDGDRRAPAVDSSLRKINLEVITTNLNQGRPYRLPVDAEHLYFDPNELADVFSSRLIAFLVAHARPATEHSARLHAIAAAKGLIPLPLPADLPVAFAIRLSLSFPLLIGAVPLWGFDFTYAAPDYEGKKEDPLPTRCWFSDGGITSNFPIHFFDGPIPRWPTFGFNLTPFHPRFPPQPKSREALNVWLPNGNGDGLQETWDNPPDDGTSLAKLSWFLFQVVGTMQNWRDNLQLRIPGFRDRVAQVHQSPDEGGINLNMQKPIIDALSDRGRIAAQILAERFSNAPPPQAALTWDNHAWVRLRTAMGLLETHLAKIERAYRQKEGLKSYSQLIAAPPPAYHFADPLEAAVMLGELDALARRWGTFGGLLEENLPHPLAELRTMPKV